MITSELYNIYKDTVAPQLKAKRGYKNPMEVPKLVKIVLSTGVKSDADKEVMTAAVDTLSAITGQKAVIAKSRKNISNFKLRKGMAVGAHVTLRREMMYNFLYRLINIVLPRVRDFRGVSSTSFDGVGNYNFGLSEQSVFTEIDLDKVKHNIGMNICIVTTARTDDEARDLLAMLGMPFADQKGN
ncbi:MAG: 50S ribosomal protein L5 [Victivallales bacterium]|nr:50S ribosomal protein L5 [Victivallales bacterium]